MRLLIFGGRTYGVIRDSNGNSWLDGHAILTVLKKLRELNIPLPTTTIINGGARGADTIGALLGEALGCLVETHIAEWDKYGWKAGPIRNLRMLKSGIDMAIALPGGKGTSHMRSLLEKEGVPVYDCG